VLRQVELIEEFNRGAELHIRVLTHDRFNRAKAVITDETVKAQLAFFVVVRVHARTFGASAAGAFIAAERAVLSGLNSQVRQQPNGIILEASLNKLKLVVNGRELETDEPFNFGLLNHNLVMRRIMQRCVTLKLAPLFTLCNLLILRGLQGSPKVRSATEIERSDG
jgi:hypothetical protein